jgi:hypothetical protein
MTSQVLREAKTPQPGTVAGNPGITDSNAIARRGRTFAPESGQ